MKFSVFQISRKGGRARNEDRMGYCYTRESALFVLADGLGGHPGGDTAAHIALQTVASRFQREALPKLACPSTFLASALLMAHQVITRRASTLGLQDPPRTTLVAAVAQEGALTWIHCGDSRLYLVRAGHLLARTRDHSYAAHQARVGRVQDPIQRNLLFTCLGSPVNPIHDLGGPVRLRQQDKFLLCSDGLWDSLPEARILQRLQTLPVDAAGPQLAQEALRAGGRQGDNVTLIAVEWETPAAGDSRYGVSTEGLSPDGFASSLQRALLPTQDPGADDLDDAAIERSIAEINETIRRFRGS